jgi:hypothetical protein
MTKLRKQIERYIPEISTLLRDAEPTWAEIEGEQDPRKRRDRERARDVANDELLSMYRDAEKRDALDQLDYRVRVHCEQLRERNGGKLPTRKGGRPFNEHQRLLIAVAVREAISAQTSKRKNVARAIRDVFERYRARFNISIETIRDLHYDRDPEWQRTVAAEMAFRALPPGQPIGVPFFQQSEDGSACETTGTYIVPEEPRCAPREVPAADHGGSIPSRHPRMPPLQRSNPRRRNFRRALKRS